MKYILIFISITFLHQLLFAQDSISNKLLSIYEFPDSVASCETNFKNLFHNWEAPQIANANEFNFLNYAFVETINDSTTYHFYRNYFSSNKCLSSAIKGQSKLVFLRISGKMRYMQGNSIVIKPGHFFDLYTAPVGRVKMPKKIKELYSDELFQLELEKTANEDLPKDSISSKALRTVSSTNIEKLSIAELKSMTLEDIKTRRANLQSQFEHSVYIGDKIYAIFFRYNSKLFTDYVVCDPGSKKVVLDHVFKKIKIWVHAE